MNLKPVHLRLEPAQVSEILRIAWDEDSGQALEFIQTVLVKQVEKALQRH